MTKKFKFNLQGKKPWIFSLKDLINDPFIFSWADCVRILFALLFGLYSEHHYSYFCNTFICINGLSRFYGLGFIIIHSSISPPTHPCIHLSIHLFIHSATHLPTHQSTHPPTHPPTCPQHNVWVGYRVIKKNETMASALKKFMVL